MSASDQTVETVDENGPSITWSGLGRYPTVAEWRMTLRKGTDYRAGLLAICRHYNITPEELAKLDSKEAREKILKFLTYLKQNAQPYGGKRRHGQFSINSIKPYMTHIQSFTEYWEISLPWPKIQKMYPEEVGNDLRAYRREEITKLLEFADVREKSMILAPVSSGMREGAVAGLELKHLSVVTIKDGSVTRTPLIELFRIARPNTSPQMPPSSIGMVAVYGNSKRAKYVSFMTPEAMAHVIADLQYRRSQHEKLKPNTPIIRDHFAPFGYNFGRKINEPKHIGPSRVNQLIRTICHKAGLPMDELQPLHGLRKFFDTMCKNAGIDNMFKEVYMGHSVKLDDVYYDVENPESLTKMVTEYVKGVEMLTIDPKFRLQKELSAIKAESKKKDELISRYEVISTEFQSVLKVATDQQKRIDDLERRLGEHSPNTR